MPNHITNIVKIEGDSKRITKLRSLIKGETSIDLKNKQEDILRIIDFNKIMPMPESLRITSGSNVDNAINVLTNNMAEFSKMLDWQWVKELKLKNAEEVKEHISKGLSQESIDEGKLAIENISKYGYKDWYQWSIANWGTKWNAYDQYIISENEFSFDTAWSMPFPIFEKLSSMFPELTIIVTYADEDIGSNCGRLTFCGGSVIDEYAPEGYEATKFASEVKGWDMDEDLAETLIMTIAHSPIKELESMREDILLFAKDNEHGKEFVQAVLNEIGEDTDKKEALKKILLGDEAYEVLSLFA